MHVIRISIVGVPGDINAALCIGRDGRMPIAMLAISYYNRRPPLLVAVDRTSHDVELSRAIALPYDP